MKKILALLLACTLFSAPSLFAEMPREGMTYVFNFYDDNAQNIVIAPSVSLSKKISEHFSLGARLGVDAITSATKTSQASSAPAAPGEEDEEGESGLENMHMRYAPSLTGTYDKNDDTVTAGGYYSMESTYTGRSLFAAYTRRMNLNNTALGIGFKRSFDNWKTGADRQLPDDRRRESALDLSATQLLSPKSSLQFTYSSIRSDGFIAQPTQTLVTSAFTVYEQYPVDRSGDALALRLITLLNEPTSLHVYYRYYRDDWRIKSDTVNLELYRDLSPKFTLGARYRYYRQGKAFFAKGLDAYTQSDQLIAVDYRMYAFRTDTAGVMAILKPSRDGGGIFDGDKVKLKLSADYFTTSKNNNIQYVYHTDRLSGVFTTIAVEYDF